MVAVKNPDSPATAAVSGRAPQYPGELRQRFGTRHWVRADPPAFLDVEGTDLVLISASADVEEDLGVRLDVEAESAHFAEVLRELPLENDRALAPLLRGQWERS